MSASETPENHGKSTFATTSTPSLTSVRCTPAADDRAVRETHCFIAAIKPADGFAVWAPSTSGTKEVGAIVQSR